MSYRFLVWNIKQYSDVTAARTRTIADTIRQFNPDVFGILEFRAKNAARQLITEFYADYDFGMTDSKVALEILVGWRRNHFSQVIYTQRRDFLADNINLRPGGLLSVQQRGQTPFENILFLHTDSGKDDEDFRNRQTMFKKIWSLRKGLAELPIQQRQPRLIALGDLNTMGRSRTARLTTVPAQDEVDQLATDAADNQMTLLRKSHPKTWSNASGRKKGELDHVIASNDLTIQTYLSTDTPYSPFEIEVNGWVNSTGSARRSFIENISDHCLLVGDVVT